jgi:hypothetical protein
MTLSVTLTGANASTKNIKKGKAIVFRENVLADAGLGPGCAKKRFVPNWLTHQAHIVYEKLKLENPELWGPCGQPPLDISIKSVGSQASGSEKEEAGGDRIGTKRRSKIGFIERQK